MQLLLVKCDSNWADEFDLKGFAIYVDVAWKEYLKLVDITRSFIKSVMKAMSVVRTLLL